MTTKEDNQSKKHKVKDLTPEEKKEFLHRMYIKSREDHPELYAMFDRMKLTEEDSYNPDERTRNILGL